MECRRDRVEHGVENFATIYNGLLDGHEKGRPYNSGNHTNGRESHDEVEWTAAYGGMIEHHHHHHQLINFVAGKNEYLFTRLSTALKCSAWVIEDPQAKSTIPFIPPMLAKDSRRSHDMNCFTICWGVSVSRQHDVQHIPHQLGLSVIARCFWIGREPAPRSGSRCVCR
jgi:hypothetical protein